MEKGKRYLILCQNKKKKKLIREIQLIEETKTCYKVDFKSVVKNDFSLDLFDEKIEWILKKDFESAYEILEELPERQRYVVPSYSSSTLDEITKNTTMDELFGKKEEEKQ